jgi:hypothetical protein
VLADELVERRRSHAQREWRNGCRALRAASEKRSLMRRKMLRTGMEAAVRVSNVSVVYLYVRDMERSLTFYRDLLGIPLEGDEDWTEATFPAARASRCTLLQTARTTSLRHREREPRSGGRRSRERLLARTASRCAR